MVTVDADRRRFLAIGGNVRSAVTLKIIPGEWDGARQRLRPFRSDDPRIGNNAYRGVRPIFAHMALRTGPIGILVPTDTGAMARRIARFRLPVRITAVSRSKTTCQALQLVYGVDPVHRLDRPDWHAFAREHFEERARSEPGVARILMTEHLDATAAGRGSRLEILELQEPVRGS